MRLFIAIDYPPKLKSEITQLIQNLQSYFPQINKPEKISWTKLENLHLTLKFLGNIGTNQKSKLREIKRGLEETVAEVKPFKLEFTNIGFFENQYLVFWVGIKASHALVNLIDKIEARMGNLGFAKEKRISTPHITIGRGKHLPTNIKKKIMLVLKDKRGSILPKPFQVKEISLMESKLTPKGPIYTTLAKFTFSLTREYNEYY